tara:strand:+ start:46664 stop:47728 length:1065 start_codon:yes stop_codon:yes gene_type:complete
LLKRNIRLLIISMDKIINYNDKINDKIKKYCDFENIQGYSLITKESSNILNIDNENMQYIFNFEKVNNIRRVNKFHEIVNKKLNNGNIYLSCGETLESRRARIRNKVPIGFKTILRIIDFFYKRVLPKLPIIRKFYFFATQGHNRVMSKPEILGRLISCGFEILEYFEIEGLLYVISKKDKDPEFNMDPSYGPIFKMNRIGYKGKIIKVYKIRTMYPYSEYCQKLIMDENNLSDSGKFFNDYRVTTWGKIFRKFWIDEIPMFINFFKGELNLIGVRPLSEKYFSTYPEHLQKLRIKVKPGLIPPYYADLPENFDAILNSEEEYLNQKLKSPIRTDIKYFFKAMINIFLKGARSH